jgi:hypothetical protein
MSYAILGLSMVAFIIIAGIVIDYLSARSESDYEEDE